MPLFKKQRNETSAKAPVRLTRAEQKEIQAVIRRYKGDGKPHSAQKVIPTRPCIRIRRMPGDALNLFQSAI